MFSCQPVSLVPSTLRAKVPWLVQSLSATEPDVEPVDSVVQQLQVGIVRRDGHARLAELGQCCPLPPN